MLDFPVHVRAETHGSDGADGHGGQVGQEDLKGTLFKHGSSPRIVLGSKSHDGWIGIPITVRLHGDCWLGVFQNGLRTPDRQSARQADDDAGDHDRFLRGLVFLQVLGYFTIVLDCLFFGHGGSLMIG